VQVHVVVVHPRGAGRSALADLVRQWGWTVVGEGRDGFEAVTLARAQGADVLLLDGSSSGQDVVADLDEVAGGPVVIRLLERPQEHAAGKGVAILKGVPADRLRARIVKELEGRRHFGSGRDKSQGRVGNRDG
jgi:CheY-like chemotaxis protein